MILLRRKWLVGLLCLGMFLLLLAPTIVCRTGIANHVLARISERSGVSIRADAVVVGWFTPLKLKKTKLTEAGLKVPKTLVARSADFRI